MVIRFRVLARFPLNWDGGLSQLCIVVLAVECTIILTYAINRARFVKKTSYVPWPMRRCIANPSVRFTCSLVSLIMITGAECVALELLYGFGSDQKHPRLCNFKFYEGHEWDSERIMVYNWVTFTTPIASLCLGVFLIAYVYGQGYGKKHAPTSGIWKLAFIPTMYFALQTPFLLSGSIFGASIFFSSEDCWTWHARHAGFTCGTRIHM